MDPWQCCRTCLSDQNLNVIFQLPEHYEKYCEVILVATGVKVNFNDTLPQQMCAPCMELINTSYKFRKKCEDSQRILMERLNSKTHFDIKIEPIKSDNTVSIDISDLIIDNEFRDFDDDMALSVFSQKNKNELNLQTTIGQQIEIEINQNREKPEKSQNRERRKKENKEVKKTCEKKQRVKENIECEMCHKVLTSKLSLRNHYKIHTGFDVVCEHCGKKFITRRLLLMHCKAKHGYEKTDKCSYCDYRASNAEQVKIHERLHTGEKPFVCAHCGAAFHRRSSYLQHTAIHLPDKPVQCDQCPARFKSVTLMRIHRSRHRPPSYTYKCRVCDNSFARRRNVVRHLQRIHSLSPTDEHIHRHKHA